MSYFAVAVARTPDGWAAAEMELAGAEDIDEVTDLVRESDPTADLSLLFLEQDDEYVGIVRVDADADEPRVFLSDGRAAESFPLAAILADAIVATDPDAADEDAGLEPEPVGDADLLGDLGTRRRELLALCEHEGTLPSDLISEVCERAGCLEQIEALRV